MVPKRALGCLSHKRHYREGGCTRTMVCVKAMVSEYNKQSSISKSHAGDGACRERIGWETGRQKVRCACRLVVRETSERISEF